MKEEKLSLGEKLMHWVEKPRSWIAGWVRQVRSLDLTVFLAGLFIVLSVWGFIGLAEEVMEGETHALDHWVVTVLRNPENPAMPRGPLWLVNVAKDITALGSYAVLSILTLATAGFLLALGKRRSMWLLLAATSSGALLSPFLKMFFARARPDIPHDLYLTPWSFPSGHALGSAMVYLTLGAMLARTVPGRMARLYVLGLAVFLSLLVGVTRVYLGAHYPTDVLAGWSAGFAWAMLCRMAARYLQKRDRVQ